MSKQLKRMILFPGYTAHNDHLPLASFKQVAATAAECGFTHVDIGNAMIARSRHQLDNNGEYCDGYDFYPEYTAAFADFFKFHCPDALRKVIPADYVERNMAELHQRSEVLRELGLKGAFIGAAPQFLPEAIYQEHPTWRGARCDMPFRSRRPYFAPCVDNEEVLALYREASDHIGQAAPVIDTAIFLCVDSGTGLCWFDGLYPGKNGPQACAHRPMDERIAGFTEALGHGFQGGSSNPLVHLTHAPFWSLSGYLAPHPGAKNSEWIVFARAPNDKPLLHENPLAMLSALETALAHVKNEVLVFNVEQPQVLFKPNGLYPSLVKKFLKRPTRGPTDRILFMKELAADLGLEEKNNNYLLDAWQHLYRAMDDLSRLYHNSIIFYSCLSARYLTRPLLPLPENVGLEDRMYFHKHVFNSRDDEQTRNDLLNVHGIRGGRFLGRTAHEADRSVICCQTVRTSLDHAIASLENGIQTATAGAAASYYGDTLRRIKGLRCFIINLQNICAFQAILDRAVDGYSPTANSTLLEQVMRAEIDNMQVLINLLEEGEPPLIPLAKNAEDENTFLFGPDLASHLKKKIALMFSRWYDSQVLFANKSIHHP